jgi:Ca-activated chloride channel family protein
VAAPADGGGGERRVIGGWLPGQRPRRFAASVVFCIALLAAVGVASVAAIAAADPAGGTPTPSATTGPPAAAPTASPSPEATSTEPTELSPEHRRWLEDHELLLGPEEVEAFLALRAEYQRTAFVDRFWRERDPHPDTARNELRDTWERRLEEVRQKFGDVRDARARTLLLNGPPDARVEVNDCVAVFPLEVWFYGKSKRVREEIYMIFFRPGGVAAYRLWEPLEGTAVLSATQGTVFRDRADEHVLNQVPSLCSIDVAPFVSAAIRTISGGGEFGWMTYALEVAKLEAPLLEPGGEWLATFASYSTDLPPGAPTFPAAVDVTFLGRRHSRTLVQVAVGAPVADLTPAALGAGPTYHLLVTGEVLREGSLLDRFRYRFDFPAPPEGTATLPLVFERPLRPGSYHLLLMVEDVTGGRYHRVERELVVPAVGGPTPLALDDPDPLVRRLAAAAELLDSGGVAVELLRPVGEAILAGKVRFDALVLGDGVAQVDFALDGQPMLSKREAPWSVELDLGRLPRPRTLTATVRDATGAALAEDEMIVNASSQRFALRISSPLAGQQASGSVRLVTAIDVPKGERVERLEVFRDETLVATLYQPPWAQQVALPGGGAIAALRAVAWLADGTSVAADRLVNAPPGLVELDVQLVELYTSVLDRQSRPVEGLAAGDFAIREDGVEQTLVRFERVRDLPIRAGLLLDVSASMAPDLGEAQRAALDFLSQTVGPRDKAALITFNDRPELAVELTGDLVSLGGGLAGLKAERGTALYDSVVFALYYFNGIAGQRALIVLSDGKDESSRFDLQETLELARRAGVTIYGIGLGLEGGDHEAKRALERLAEETGGRALFPGSAAELAPAYAAIEDDLRSQYLLVYQSTNEGASDRFRKVEVDVARRGVDVRTLRGYYP